MKKISRRATVKPTPVNCLFRQYGQIGMLKEISEGELELGPVYNSPVELSDTINMFDRFVLGNQQDFE